MSIPKKSLIDDNYQRAQEIVSMPHGSKNYGYKSFRRDFSPDEREKILRRVSQVGVKQAADEYGASLNVVKGWLKELDRAIEEPVKTPKETAQPETETETKLSKDFSEKEKAKILERAKETSITQAAKEANTTYWVIRKWILKQSKKENKPAKKTKETQTSEKKVFLPEERAVIVKDADKIGLLKAAAKYNVSWQAINAWKYYAKPVEDEQPVEEVSVEEIAQEEAAKNLEIENQILKKKAEMLVKEFNRLKKAIADLTELLE